MTCTSPRRLVAPGLLGAAILLAGCGGGSERAPEAGEQAAGTTTGALSVVASTDVWADVASAVGGEAVEVTSFISDPSQDPHSYEASARDQLAVLDAAVVVENGGGYDDFMERLVSASGTGATVVDAVEASGLSAPDDDELNEHVWYDMASVAAVADEVAEALGEADPGAASTFTDNAEAFAQELAGIEASQAAVAQAAGGTEIVVTEPVPLAMTQACGLVDVTPAELSQAVEEGSDVSPAVLADTEALLTQGRVAALVLNAQTSGPETDAVQAAAEVGGVPVVTVTETLPEGEDFVSWMTGNVEAIATAVTS